MSKPAHDHTFVIQTGTAIDAVLTRPPIDRLEARILLMHALRLSRSQLITQSHRCLTPNEAQHLTDLFQRRIAGEPIAYLVGEREFYGRSLFVTPDVLIPRPDTELLVDLALQKLPPSGILLDLGTGSGAIAIALAHSRPDARVTALDASAAALDVARRNAVRYNIDMRLLQSDWYSAVADACFDLIVSNPPYIPAHDIHLSQGDLRFEPISALTDHDDGLSALRMIVGSAHRYLAPGGWLLVEHGYDQAASVRALFAQHDFNAVQSWRDLANIERVTGGQFPSAIPSA